MYEHRPQGTILISTHDLTKRSTIRNNGRKHGITISTHDLTKRSTVASYGFEEKEVFQLTTSRRGRRYDYDSDGTYKHFNSRPHEEVDLVQIFTSKLFLISTHDLTKRSTVYAPLTVKSSYNHFNSRPHEEVDRY